MEKFSTLSLKLLLLFSLFPIGAKVRSMAVENSEALPATNTNMNAQAIRVRELKTIDKSLLSVAEKKLLRAELYAMQLTLKKHSRHSGDVIYISAAILVGIILLIILI